MSRCTIGHLAAIILYTLGIAFCLIFVATAISLILPSKAEARFAATVAARTPVTTTSTMTSTNAMMMTAVVIAASSDGAQAREVKASTPLLTACTADQLKAAKAWQDDCHELDSVSGRYCSLLSYQRHCDAITPDEAQGLVTAGDGYRNTYLKGE